MDPQLPPASASAAAALTWMRFKVRWQEPELVSPAKPTPRELKLLSDIDDQGGLRFHIPIIQIYRRNPSKSNVDPVRVIRQSLAETLVHFYPFAGRLREGPNRKLMVDCTGEGVIFIEADADVELEEFGDDLKPPFPCFEELLFDVPGSNGVLNSPLMLIQVTRLKCGGFIFAMRFCHTMSDGPGIFLFMNTLAEMARGANAPSVWPAWDRHLLSARVPPRITHTHHEYSEVVAGADIGPAGRMIQRSFFFGPTEIFAIRRLIPPNLRSRSTTVETLTSFLWWCRTVALRPNPDTEMRMILIVNVRNKHNNLPLPPGYYGNAFVIPAAVATAKDITEQPLEFALRLIQKLKHSVTEEYVKSVADLMVTRGRPNFTTAGTFIVSDLTRPYRFRDLDFGWGKAVYGGTAMAGAGPFPAASYYVSHKNKNGVEGIVVPICLPELAMERFVEELDEVLANKKVTCQGSNKHDFRMSSL